MTRNFIKQFIPPIFLSILSKFKVKKKNHSLTWSGNYSTWKAAKEEGTGYNAINILEACNRSLLEVKNGKAAYERDSVLFSEVQYSWGLLAGLQKIALTHNGQLSVLDFGGSLGSSYYQNKDFLNTLKTIEWSIVEQAHFVECGKINFENKQLKFYLTIEDCLKACLPNALLLSGVLQYLENPYEWLLKLLSYNIEYLLIDRNSFIKDRQRITLQNVPEWIYKASYPCWFFNEENFLIVIKEKYSLVAAFESSSDIECQSEDGKQLYWKGFIFKKKP
jgi:putative methyltransferase (TIGR04325 family)